MIHLYQTSTKTHLRTERHIQHSRNSRPRYSKEIKIFNKGDSKEMSRITMSNTQVT